MARSTAPESAIDELHRAIQAISGRSPSTEVRRRFATYLELLTVWNRTHHLSGYRTPRDIVRRLFIDSLLFLPLLPPRPHRLMDIGSGPGIPGVPLRIVDAGIGLTIVESRRKPVSFLAALKRELALEDVSVVHGRANSEVSELKGQYDCVVSRAVRLDEELLAAALSYLKPGGRFVSSAGPPSARSVADTPRGARIEEVSFPALGYRRLFHIHSR